MKRLFVAAFPPTEVVEAVRNVIAEMSGRLPARAVRWTQPGQVHLTLSFLGSTGAGRISEIETALRSACKEFAPVDLDVRRLGCFPNSRRPRVIWAGASGQLDMLRNLKDAIDAHLVPMGFQPEVREFHPHLTLGRTAELDGPSRSQLLQFLNAAEAQSFGNWRIDRIDLMESAPGPLGSSYHTLNSIALIRGA